MSNDELGEISRLLQVITDGQKAQAALIALVYDELREVAARKMRRERPGHTLQATEVVHEALLRLRWKDMVGKTRGYFFSAVAEAMCRVLIEHARKKNRRDGLRHRVPWIDEVVNSLESDVRTQITDIEAALEDLQKKFRRKYDIFMMIHLGYKRAEVAKRLGVPARKISPDYAFARRFLRAAIAGQDS